MDDTGIALRRKIPEIVIEAVMVVFAAFVAFNVDQWREEQQLRQTAVDVRSEVENELAENLEEFRNTGIELQELVRRLQEVVKRGRLLPGEELDFNVVELLLEPQMSAAAWRVAQASQARRT